MIHTPLLLQLLPPFDKVPSRTEGAVRTVKNCDIRRVVVVELDESLGIR